MDAKLLAVSLALTALVSACAKPEGVFHNCSLKGEPGDAREKKLNLLKNRYQAPGPQDFDTRVSLAAMLAPGPDRQRWDESRAATITGYVHDVFYGGVESTNCFSRDPRYRDTHIELVPGPGQDGPAQRVIVEVTPRWRAVMLDRNRDWTTEILRMTIKGKWVKVSGWLMYDLGHEREAENDNPGGKENWRATNWEIHPVTDIAVLDGPPKQ